MLFVDGKSIAYATSHTLTISGDTQDTSNKDEGGGNWASSEVSILNWTATSDNLYSEDGEGNNFADLFDIMIAKTPVQAVFSPKSQMNLTDVPTGGWSTSYPMYEGNVVITSLEVNAPNGEYATFTA
jgi:TP901-1 family phage major tail protein